MRALWTAATGMHAQQVTLDVISNNLANVQTAGFKRSRVDFQDLVYEILAGAGSGFSPGTRGAVRFSSRTWIARGGDPAVVYKGRLAADR